MLKCNLPGPRPARHSAAEGVFLPHKRRPALIGAAAAACFAAALMLWLAGLSDNFNGIGRAAALQILLFAPVVILGLVRCLQLFGGQSRASAEMHRIEGQARQLEDQAEALQAARDEALAATEAKSFFLANMSHEIRTPLNGILGMAQILDEENLSPAQREYVEIIESAAKDLLCIINDILDTSKIEANKLDLVQDEFSLRTLIRNIVALLEPQLIKKSVEFVPHIDPRIPDRLIGDPTRLRQIIINLLGNAGKFTNPGGAVLLGVFLEQRQQQEAQLLFSVIDTGIGIPDDRQSKIFGAFDQADSSVSTKYGGTGLGLSISSKLVALMGGEVKVRSRVGIGSVFHFTLTLKTVEAAAVAGINVIRPDQQNSKLKVLLVEDNPVNCKLSCILVGRYGHEIATAADGLEALELMEKQKFDLILMDCQMPRLDGYRATEEIRKREKGSGVHIPIVALTAHAMDGAWQKCMSAGMDDYLSKPIDKRELQNILLKYTKRE